jgi:predicted nucleic acid-binding protein
VSAQVGGAIFDASTLANFAVVDRLDLLENRFGYRAVWTEAVRLEITRGLSAEPNLQRILDANWLGDPTEISANTASLRQIELIRRGLGGTQSNPLQHLGEAEIIFYLEHDGVGGILITDDRPAANFARNRSLQVMDSAQVLSECFSYGEIGCPAAYDLLLEMADHNRGVYLPPDHTYVC